MTPAATITVLPTVYRGTTFRSRLEARWAVFFDTLGVRWEYEPEGFALPSGNYLPDFWLPGLDMYAEVKPEPVDDPRHPELAEATQKSLAVLCGPVEDPPWSLTGVFWLRAGHYDGHYVWLGGAGADNENASAWKDNWHTFTVCSSCNAIGFVFSNKGDRICMRYENGAYTHSSPPNADRARCSIEEAYEAARTHRFWDPR